METKLTTCHHCGEEKENCRHKFIALTLPVPELEEKIDKWGRGDWWENLERTDLSLEEVIELDDLSMYDQLLNTIGRGAQCSDCEAKEIELYNKYYP